MAKIYSQKIRKRARNLRRKGWSLGEISLKMKIPKNTISSWVRDIQLTNQQTKRIKEKIASSGVVGRPLAIEVNRKKIEQWKEDTRNSVKHFENIFLNNPELGKLACGLLYLCEGSKYPSTRCLVFGNSDPWIIRCFINLLRNSFNIDEKKLRCRIMFRYDQNLQELNKYWSNITRIPLHNFYKSKPDSRTKGKSTLKDNYKGICAVHYLSTNLQFKLQSIGEIIIKSGAGGDRTLDPLPARQMLVPAELQPQNLSVDLCYFRI